MAKLQIGAKDPLDIPDEILSAYRTRVQGGEDANKVALDFFGQARNEIDATLNNQTGGYDNSVLSKYGLSDNSYGTFAGARTAQDTPVLALASFLQNKQQPTQYDPITKQVVAGTVTPTPTFSSNRRSNNASPVTPGKYIITGDGREINYDFADPTLRAQADSGQLRTRQDANYRSAGIATPPPITADSIQAGINALNERIRNEGITDASGKVLLAPTGNSQGSTVLPGTVNADSLKGSSTNYQLPGSTNNSNLADLNAAGSATSLKNVEEYVKLLTPPESATSQSVKTLTETINKELEALKGRGAAQLSEEAKQGVEQKKQALMSVKNQINTKLAEYQVLKANYDKLQVDNENRSVTMGSIIGTGAAINRAALADLNGKSAELGVLQAQALGLQGDYDAAVEAANRAVDLRFNDVLDSIKIRQEQLKTLEGQLSKEEGIRASAIQMYLADQQRLVEEQKAEQKQLSNFNLDAMSRYPSANIQVSDTYETTQQKIVNSREYQLAVAQDQAGLASTQALIQQRGGVVGVGGGSSGGLSGGRVGSGSGTGGGTGGSAGGKLSPISQSVVENPSLFYNFTPTQKGQIVSELQANGYDISQLQNAKLSSGQQDDIAGMNTVSGLINEVLAFNADGKLEGIGSFGVGTLKSFGAQLGFGSEEGKSVRAKIGNIQGTIAKLRGGTSFTPNEQALLSTYTPTINDSPAVAINKLTNLQSFIERKNADLLSASRQNITTGQIQKKGQSTDLRTKYSY